MNYKAYIDTCIDVRLIECTEMNVIDLLVVIISCWNTGTHRKFVNVTPIRMLRWFYVKRSKRMAKGGDNQTIMAS